MTRAQRNLSLTTDTPQGFKSVSQYAGYPLNFVAESGGSTFRSAEFEFYIPDESVIIDAQLRMKFSSYRTHTRDVANAAATTPTSGASSASSSAAGGGQTPTSGASSSSTTTAAGAQTPTSSAGGATTPTTSAGGGVTVGNPQSPHDHNVFGGVSGNVDHHHSTGPNDRTSADFALLGTHNHGVHAHTVSIGTHSHSVSVGAHSHGMNHDHTVTVNGHTHDISHTHSVTVPAHGHASTFDIFEEPGMPSGVSVRLDGVTIDSLLGGPWSPSAGQTVDVSLTGVLVHAGWHSLRISAGSGKGRVTAFILVKSLQV